MSEYTDPRSYSSERYALSGKIMLSAIVILFAVVVLIICLHIYARWYLERARRRQRRTLRNRRRNSRAHIIFTTDMPSTAVSHGLDPSLLKLLPTFIYSSTSHGDELLECAVCLSEFEENEKGRLLPKCNHTFHIGCIDMWFSSHSTCPLCRSPVVVNSETHQTEPTPIEIVVESVDVPPSATSSSGQDENAKEEEMGCSSNSNQNPLSVGSRRKGFEIVGVSIDVPRRNESFKSFDEDSHGSPGGGFKSPGGRILSFRRMLSRAGRPSTPMPLSCGSSTIDLEKGETQETSTPQPPPPPHPQPPGHFHDHQRTNMTVGVCMVRFGSGFV